MSSEVVYSLAETVPFASKVAAMRLTDLSPLMVSCLFQNWSLLKKRVSLPLISFPTRISCDLRFRIATRTRRNAPIKVRIGPSAIQKCVQNGDNSQSWHSISPIMGASVGQATDLGFLHRFFSFGIFGHTAPTQTVDVCGHEECLPCFLSICGL